MELIKSSHDVIDLVGVSDALCRIEKAGRTCYKSEDKITPTSAERFVQGILDRGHESVIEHVSASVRFICDRGVSHEIVRHRIASYSQESTRYVNYTKKGIAFVIPPWTRLLPGVYGPDEIDAIKNSSEFGDDVKLWVDTMEQAESRYNKLTAWGWKPEQARSILPNALKTELVMTANLRSWRHFFTLRTAKGAHPQMREVAIPLLKEFQRELPVLFGSIIPHE